MYRFIIYIIFVIASLIWFTWAWSYPLKWISKPECKYKYSDFSELPSNCKIKFPRIYNWNYRKYKSNELYKLVYSVLWMSTYKDWWDYWKWSHLWVDIASIKGTPVYAIEDWFVEYAWWKYWWGNVVVIKHKFKWSYIRSIYAHMDKVLTKKGKYVKEWELIWKVWNTWFSFGNHLHFQIDISDSSFHPYYPLWCGSDVEMVNKWLCQNFILLNTTDPILFIEKKWSYLNFSKLKKLANKLNKRKNVKNNHFSPSKKVISKVKKNNSSKLVLSNKQPSKISVNKRTNIKKNAIKDTVKIDPIQKFLSTYNINLSTNKLVINKWSSKKVYLYIKNKRTKRWFNWSIPEDIKLVYSKKGVISAVPNSKIKYISEWKRVIRINWLKSWTENIFVKFWNKTLWVVNVTVVDNSKMLDVKSAYAKIYGDVYVWDSNIAVVSFVDKNWYEIKTNNFKWRYNIFVSNWYICKVNINSSYQLKRLKYYKCEKDKMFSSVDIEGKDTIWGKYIFKIYPLNKWPVKIYVLDKYRKQIWSSFVKIAKLPKDVKKINVKYKDKIIFWFRQWYIQLYKNWYFSPHFDLKWKDLKLWIWNKYRKKLNIKDYEKITYEKFKNIMSSIWRNINIRSSKKIISRQEAAYWIMKTR